MILRRQVQLALPERHRRFMTCAGIVVAVHLIVWGALSSLRSAHAVGATVDHETSAVAVSLIFRSDGQTPITAEKSTNALIQPAPVVETMPAPPATHDASPTTAALPALLSVPEQYYYSTAELTKRPDILVDHASDLAFHLPGLTASTTILRLFINQFGEVDDVVMDDDTLPESVRQAVLAAFKTNRFIPGELNGFPVKTRLTIELTLEGRALDMPMERIAAAGNEESEPR